MDTHANKNANMDWCSTNEYSNAHQDANSHKNADAY
jgi:hypothetical protein